MNIGPNVRKLIAARMALLAIPLGSGKGSFELGLNALLTPGKTAEIGREAAKWVEETIKHLRAEPDCPWSNDEEVASDILSKLSTPGLVQ